MSERDRFEIWCTSRRDKYGLCFFTVKKPDSNEYVDQGTNDAWEAWEERAKSTDSLLSELAELVEKWKEKERSNRGCGDFCDGVAHGYDMCSEAIQAILEM